MVYKIADNIVSPLGKTTEQNYQAVKQGETALSYHTTKWDIPEPFTASVFSETQNQEMAVAGLTRFESMVVCSVRQALAETAFDIAAKNVVFILSTTKANVELLGSAEAQSDVLHPGESAARIAKVLGITTSPVVVCNACISGLSGIILAQRLLESKTYDYAIVCGADVLDKFIISGFQSFKSMAEHACRPYDIERLGMNLGEAAATIVLSATPALEDTPWAIGCGTVRNDAHHISTPSNKGEGAYRCLLPAIHATSVDSLALVNAHGTATMFMDQMESVAIQRAGLAGMLVNSLKGYYGHTLGAAGVLETVLTMHALDDHTLIGTRGFEELGVSGKIEVSATNAETDKHTFIKLISGFGGCNAALLATKTPQAEATPSRKGEPQKRHHIVITPTSVTLDGKSVACEDSGKDMLTHIYKQTIGDYPKFYKMDMLSRLGFIASELLITAEGKERFAENEQRAVILFNHSSSIHADTNYLESIKDPDNYFPSPSLFVYTLPNIVTGEIAIRNHYYGETSFFILPQKDETIISQVQRAAFSDPMTHSMMTGWLDYEDDDNFLADMYIMDYE